jgi:hypothetical protein
MSTDPPDPIMPGVEAIPERVDRLEVEVTDLDTRVGTLQSQATVADEEVIYRPPLWSQNSAYSASDDRRLIMAALRSGVIDLTDLKVIPRQEGANLSVDVLPGIVVIAGTDQADQGNYVCALSQRVNIPLPAGPAAGNHRRDYIYARVFEPGGEEPAYWQVECAPGPPGPSNQEAPYIFDHPPSTYILGVVQYITSGTSVVSAQMIFDYRKLARPAPTGECILRQVSLGMAWPPPNPVRWGPELRIATPPPGPLDIEVRIEGSVNWYYEPKQVWIWPRLFSDRAGQRTVVAQLDPGLLWVAQSAPVLWFSRTLIVEGITTSYPDQLWCETLIQSETHQAQPVVMNQGRMTMRITPSGSALAW